MLKTKAVGARSKPKASRRPARPRTRRTTLTLPEDLLKKVANLATERHQTLSAAVTTLIQEPLARYDTTRRNGSLLELWRKSLAGLTEEEQMLVDGIILEEPEG